MKRGASWDTIRSSSDSVVRESEHFKTTRCFTTGITRQSREAKHISLLIPTKSHGAKMMDLVFL